MTDAHTQPRMVTRDGFTVMGTEIRTTNELEGDPATARIGEHWQRFYGDAIAERIPNRTDDAVTYGVYTDYESDDRAAYSQLIACEVRDGASSPSDVRTVRVPGGRYLVFTGIGEPPGVVMQTWSSVWRHFAGDTRDERAYTVDFERYDRRDPGRVEIYIALK